MMSKMAAAGNPRFMHAVPQDFCAIFNEDMSALYSLALLLTADHEMAQQCFLAALDHCLIRSGCVSRSSTVVEQASNREAGDPGC